MSTFEEQKEAALQLFHNGKYSEALPLFKDLAKTSDQDRDWFNVLTTAGLSGDHELAQTTFKFLFERTREKVELFNTLVLEGKDNDLPTIAASLPQLCFYHAISLCDGGVADKAIDPTETLVKLYSELGNTDTRFLFIRGVPAFGDFLNLFQKIKNSVGLERIQSMIQMLQQKLDEAGKNSLANALR